MISPSTQTDTFSAKSVILFLSLFAALLIIGDVLLWFRPPIGKIFLIVATIGLLLSTVISAGISAHHQKQEKTKKGDAHHG